MLKLLFKPIGCLGTILATLVVLAVIALIVLFWLAEAWTPKFVAGWMEQRSGFDVQIDDANLELFSQELVFEDIVVHNPPGFPEESFLRIRTLAVKLPLTDVADGDFRAHAVELNIDSLTLVIPAEGPSNVSAFIDAVDYQPTMTDLAAAGAMTSAPRLERFELKIGEATIENHGFRRPDIQKVKLDYDGTFENVSLSSEVFPKVEQALRERGLPGIGPAFFRALFASLPVQCFADIEPAPPNLLPDELGPLSDELETLRKQSEDALKLLPKQTEN